MDNLVQESRDVLLVYARYYNNNWDRVYWALRNKEDATQMGSVKDAMYGYGVFSDKTITILDNEYPAAIKNSMDKPPFVIYYKGDLSALNRHDYIYLNGDNRFNIPKDRIITYEKVDNTLNIGDKLLIYINNEDRNEALRLGIFLSEKVVYTKVLKSRVISALYAVQMSKDIYVVPTLEHSPNNELIKEGAYLIDSEEDLL